MKRFAFVMAVKTVVCVQQEEKNFGGKHNFCEGEENCRIEMRQCIADNKTLITTSHLRGMLWATEWDMVRFIY